MDKIFIQFLAGTAALLWGWLAFLFKSIRALLSGLLIATGNTRFVMWNESISIWLCFIIPIWVCIEFFSFDAPWAYFVAFLYNLVAALAYYLKFYKSDWKKQERLI